MGVGNAKKVRSNSRDNFRKGSSRQLEIGFFRTNEFAAILAEKKTGKRSLSRDKATVQRHQPSSWLQSRVGQPEKRLGLVIIKVVNDARRQILISRRPESALPKQKCASMVQTIEMPAFICRKF